MSVPLCVSELDHASIPLLGSREGGKSLKLKSKESLTFEKMCSPFLDGDSLGKAKPKRLRNKGVLPVFGFSMSLYFYQGQAVESLGQHKDKNHRVFGCVCENSGHPVDCPRDQRNVLRAVTEIRL